jgi:Zinc-binding dehydrogenase/Alcohol dehydrogenase GroES-like domain
LKAITYHEYGPPDALEFEDVDAPVVKDDEVLVRVRAASVNPRDWHFMRGVPYFMRAQAGLRRPKSSLLGSDVAGQVEAAGTAVTRFHPGDEVLAHVQEGGFAEYAAVPEEALGLKPANLTFEQAAAVPLAGLTALQGLRDQGRVRPGQKVLIIGAAGGVGTFAVQLAKHFGADVTGVCSTRNLDLVRSIGADHVIDYTREDFTQGRPGVRPHLPVGGDPLAVGPQARAHPQGDAPAEQRRIGRPLGRAHGPDPQGARAGTVREPAAQLVPGEIDHGGPAGPEGAHRGRQGLAGDRPDLPAERGPRGHPLPGGGARPRQGRRHRVSGLPPSSGSGVRELEVGGGKVVAKAQQRLARELGNGVGHAVAEVQTRTVPASAVGDEGIGRDRPMIGRNSTTSTSASWRNRASSVLLARPTREHSTRELSTAVGAPMPTCSEAAKWSRRRP